MLKPRQIVLCVLGCVLIARGQTVKTSVASTELEPTSLAQWSRDLGYNASDIYPLIFGPTGCPFVNVDLSGVKIALMLDTGTAGGFVITTQAPSIPHRVEERHEELNADGSHRGESLGIRIDTISVLGRVFKDVAGSLSDWRMYSSVPFNGTVGLDFFLDRRLTLDYRSRTVGVSAIPLPEKLDPRRYLCIDLVDAPESHGHLPYARAVVNKRKAIVYFDTGYSVSFIDPSFVEGLDSVERPGRFKIFRKAVPFELGGQKLILDELRESPVKRGPGFDLPVALALGSDFLSKFVVTIDVRARKLILALAELK
jgi:hypothetical protein